MPPILAITSSIFIRFPMLLHHNSSDMHFKIILVEIVLGIIDNGCSTMSLVYCLHSFRYADVTELRAQLREREREKKTTFDSHEACNMRSLSAECAKFDTEKFQHINGMPTGFEATFRTFFINCTDFACLPFHSQSIDTIFCAC